MNQTEATTTLRARTRQALREHVVDAALVPFVEHGYEAVTVEQIAQTVGGSRRSLHRYFSLKDDIVLSKFDSIGDTFVELLRGRPLDEPAWASLHHIFGLLAEPGGDKNAARRDRDLTRVIHESPALFAGYLERT